MFANSQMMGPGPSITPKTMFTPIDKVVTDKRVIASKIPTVGVLSWPTIASDAGLTGVLGKETTIRLGDLQYMLTGKDSTQHIGDDIYIQAGNQNIIRTGNLTHLRTGNETITLVGSLTKTVIVAETTTNIGPTTRTFIAPCTETHASPRNLTEPTSWFQTINAEFAIKSFSSGITALKVEATGAAFGVTGYKCEVTAAETTVKTLDTGVKVLETKAGGLSAFMQGFRGWLSGAKTEAAATRAHVGPTLSGPPTSLGAN